MILTVLAAAWMAACSGSSKPADPAGAPAGSAAAKPGQQAEARKPAPALSLKDSDGRKVQLSDYKGKVVLVNFWATWCGPCKLEIPWFVEFERTYKDRGFAVLGVSMDQGGWEDVKPFLVEVGVNYRVALGDDQTAADWGGVDSLPTSFIIDRDGKIAATHIGLVSKSKYEDDLKALL